MSEWWRLFKSEKLNAAIAESFSNNPGLEGAQASLRQSQDNLQAGYGVFYPAIDAGLSPTRQKFSPARFGSSTPGSIFNLFTLSGTINYALDVFGGERRAVEGLQAQVDVQRSMVRGTYLTLSGNVANTIIAQAAYGEEIKATEAINGIEKEQVAITEKEVQAGTAPYSNVLSLKSQLAATEATLPSLRQKLAQTEHLMAILAGQAPAKGRAASIRLADLSLPTNLPVTLPSELVRHRPDILAAEAQLHSASAAIGVATAAMFPSFVLSGSVGQNSIAMQNLTNSNSNFWSFGADLSAPLFHGGTLAAQKQAAIEAYRQSLASYRTSVLSALAQVADTLQALGHDAETLDAESRNLGVAREALRLVQANYQAGLINYLQVLVAQYQYQQASIAHLQAQAQRYQDTVALFVALGGGWWNPGR